MATATANVVCDNSTLANFQSWCSALFGAWTTLGWVQTADTGQAANPPAAVPSSAYVYWVFKANDALASTTPIFVKVEVGYSASYPAIRITMGSGSNGAGTITGSVVGPVQITGNQSAFTTPGNQGASTYNCYFSGDAGSFRMMMWQNSSAAAVIFGIERSRDTSGNATSTYVTMLGQSAYTNAAHQQTMQSGSVTSYEPQIATLSSTSSGPQTEAFAGSVAANPVFPLVGFLGNPMLGFCSAAAADVAESNGTPVTVNIYGANHSYLATKQNYIACGGVVWSGSQVIAPHAMLMLYE